MSGEMLAARPDLTWKYLLQIEEAGRHATPNRGHEVIAEMESRFDRLGVLSQNVDGLHRKAGSRNVIDVHGDLHAFLCTRCQCQYVVAGCTGRDLAPRT